MKNVKVILWGLGAMGGGIGKMLVKKKALTSLAQSISALKSARAYMK